MCFVMLKGGGTGIKILAQPNAKKSQIVGLHDGMIKIALAAPPVEGKANKCLIAFLASYFEVKKRDVVLISGENSRKKVCVVTPLTKRSVVERLAVQIKDINGCT